MSYGGGRRRGLGAPADLCARAQNIMPPGWPDELTPEVVRSRLAYLEPFGAAGVDAYGYVVPQQSSGPVAVTTAEIRQALEQGCYADATPPPSATPVTGEWLGHVELQGGRMIFRRRSSPGSPPEDNGLHVAGPAASSMRAELFPAGQTGGASPQGVIWVAGSLREHGWLTGADTGPGELSATSWRALAGDAPEDPPRDCAAEVLSPGIADPTVDVTDGAAVVAYKLAVALDCEGVTTEGQLSGRTRDALLELRRQWTELEDFKRYLRERGYDPDEWARYQGGYTSSWLGDPEFAISEIEKGTWGDAERFRGPVEGGSGAGPSTGALVAFLGLGAVLLIAGRERRRG